MSTAPRNEVADDALAQSKPAFLRRVRIRGYKSIAFCDVTLEPLTIIVGRNASGKSNFVDALAFLRDVANKGVAEAVKLHGGRDAILCQVMAPLSSFLSLEVETSYPIDDLDGYGTGLWTTTVALEIALPADGQPRLVREEVRVEQGNQLRFTSYRVESGRVIWDGNSFVHPATEWLNQDRMLLGMYATSPFLDLYRNLTNVLTYNFAPEAIRQPHKPTPGAFLERDGGNLASVIETTRQIEPWAVERPSRYLRSITRGATQFDKVLQSGGYQTLQFQVEAKNGDTGVDAVIQLPAASMSDGTLRAFAAMMATFQQVPTYGSPSLVAIEEPETALHPAAMQTLVDALDEATLRTQVLLTTHSAEMLDNPTVKPQNVRVVQMVEGKTIIGPVDEASVEIVARKLSTLGGLERENQLEPDLDDQDRQGELERGRQEARP